MIENVRKGVSQKMYFEIIHKLPFTEAVSLTSIDAHHIPWPCLN